MASTPTVGTGESQHTSPAGRPYEGPSCRILMRRPPVPFAHRGGAGLWPENTAPAFLGCRTLGDFVIETDLRVTADGQLILFHDDHLERTSNGHGSVANKTLRQLLALDAGYWFTKEGSHPFRGTNLRILTLEELVRLTPGACYNVEIKPGHPDAPELLWRFLQRLDACDRFLVASADHTLMTRFREASRGQVATSASRREAMTFVTLLRTETWGWLKPRYQALQLPTHALGGHLITAPLVQAAHTLGVAVHAWTVNETAEMEDMLQVGVDGIMTDRPDLLARLLELEPNS